jgi:uncharacterized zinc-type alcohol dehydrogenase-like protein
MTQKDMVSCAGYVAQEPKSMLEPTKFQRRNPGPYDVSMDILYCGVCHSDLHQILNEWHNTIYPCMPGHEIVGRVTAVGNKVTKFKAGDISGVGCMVDSCQHCENCNKGLEQYCLNGGPILTYNSPEEGFDRPTFGGFSNKLVVTERFAVKIPDGMDLKATAPLLCAGITTFSPMQHWKVIAGQKVGVIGLGGLGHMAVKLANAKGAHVTAFTTSPKKIVDAKRLGAEQAFMESDTQEIKKMTRTFDFIISTIPQGYDINPYLEMLKVDGTFVNVGALERLEPGIDGMALAFSRHSVGGSLIGGMPETQEVINFCAEHSIKADVEVIPIQKINEAFERMMARDVRYRFVIDMSSLADT